MSTQKINKIKLNLTESRDLKSIATNGNWFMVWKNKSSSANARFSYQDNDMDMTDLIVGAKFIGNFENLYFSNDVGTGEIVILQGFSEEFVGMSDVIMSKNPVINQLTSHIEPNQITLDPANDEIIVPLSETDLKMFKIHNRGSKDLYLGKVGLKANVIADNGIWDILPAGESEIYSAEEGFDLRVFPDNVNADTLKLGIIQYV